MPQASFALLPERERLPFQTWRERSLEKLAVQLQRVASESPFYRAKWGVSVARDVGVVTEADAAPLLASLPLTEKDELRESQEREPPFGEYLACDPRQVRRIHRTSGTTGRPLVIALTAGDAAVTVSHGAQALRCAGLQPDDVVAHCLSYSMWSGGLTDHLCLEGTGAAVIPFGVGRTEQLLALPSWLAFTVLSCTPSYVGLLLERLRDGEPELLDLWAQNVRLFLVGGEPGGSSAALREEAERMLGAAVANANYGLAEVLSIFGSECSEAAGFHLHGQDALWPELLDPTTGRALEPHAGTIGELVLTHLDREAQPLVRYRTKDLLEVVAVSGCACGREGLRFRLLGRTDDMFVVRGINVFPSAIAEVLGDVPPGLREFRVVLPPTPTFDAIPLEVEVPATVADQGALSGAVADAIKARLGASAEVRLVPEGTLPRSDGKTVRVTRSGETGA